MEAMREKFYPEFLISAVPYMASLYYIEIIYAMFTLFMTAGKIPGIIIGFIFGVSLSVHIVFLYFRKNFSRIIQLVLLDLHAAYSGAFIINFIASGTAFNPATVMLFSFRFIMFIIEVPMIFYLSSEKVKKLYV
jgi:hypothetical protein